MLALGLAACGGGAGEGVDTPDAAAAGSNVRILSSRGTSGEGTSAEAAQAVNATTIVVRAGSTQLNGMGAYLLLRYNGMVIGNAEVRSTTPQDIVFTVPTVIDGGVLDIGFSNAELPTGGAARQLTLDSVTVNGTAFSPTGPGVLYDLGWGPAAYDWLGWVGGSRVAVANGAYRIPMPVAAALGAPRAVDSSLLSPEPGAYVDANTGDDANPGTASRPFKTLGSLARRQFLAGEHIHLRCGSVWRESITLTANQLSDGTHILPYGSDCATAGRPTILGADTFNGAWTKTGAVWSRALPANTPKITQLWINGSPLQTARWPNESATPALIRGTYAPTPSRFWMSDSDAGALAGRDLVGATVQVRSQLWLVETHKIKSSGASWAEVDLVTNPVHLLQPSQPWWMSDKRWMLDVPGEYFHDEATQTLYVIAPDAVPDMNAATVEGSVRDFAVDLRDRPWMTITGLALGMARVDGMRLTDAPQTQITDMQVRGNGSAGIRLWQWRALPPNTPGPLVSGSVVSDNGEVGIDATYVEAARILGNTVRNTGTKPFSGPVTASIAAGPAGQVLDNQIDGSGYIGIQFAGRKGAIIARNELRNYCQRLTDCAAVYTWNSGSSDPTDAPAYVDSNRIFAPSTALDAGTSILDVVAGIYIDDYSRSVVVRNNFLQDLPVGVVLHNASSTTVENNTIWLPRRAGIAVSMDHYERDWSVGNVVRNNSIVPMTTASANWPGRPTFSIVHPFWFSHILAGTDALARGRNEFSNNNVTQLFGTQPEHATVGGPTGSRTVSAAEWAALNVGERVPEQPLSYNSFLASLGPELVDGGNFDNGLGSWNKTWNWRLTGYDVQGVSSQAGCTGPCVRMTVVEGSDMIFSRPFTMRAGVPHVYRWTAAVASGQATIARPYISRAGTPWDDMNDATGFSTLVGALTVSPGKPLQYDAFFVPKSSDPAQVNLQLATGLMPVFFDSVSVREVTGWTFNKPADWAVPVVAMRSTAKTVNGCSDLGLPADCSLVTLTGQPIALPLTVPAGSQQLLLWANSPYRR